MKTLMQILLYSLAAMILKRYKPISIAVTGSVGKTSTKEAIYHVLHEHVSVRQSYSNYNNEFGVPLSIIGINSPGKNIFGWLYIIGKAFKMLLITVDYPEYLVLEFGADKPGDIEYLMKLVRPQFGVLTAIASVHIEQFKTLANIAAEKGMLLENLPKDGHAIVNADSEIVMKQLSRTKVSASTIGFGDLADIRAHGITLVQKNNEWGLKVIISYQGHTIPVFLPHIVAKEQIYAVLFACAIALKLNINFVDIGLSLETYRAPKGRTKLIVGIKESLLIDDSYNASPVSTVAALQTLADVAKQRKSRAVAILGDMLELGDYEEQGHREVGDVAVTLGIDLVITVGARAKDIRKAINAHSGQAATVVDFKNIAEAAGNVSHYIERHDTVLIKGSQGARMEHLVKQLMRDQSQAKDLLVRQSKRWEQIG